MSAFSWFQTVMMICLPDVRKGSELITDNRGLVAKMEILYKVHLGDLKEHILEMMYL